MSDRNAFWRCSAHGLNGPSRCCDKAEPTSIMTNAVPQNAAPSAVAAEAATWDCPNGECGYVNGSWRDRCRACGRERPIASAAPTPLTDSRCVHCGGRGFIDGGTAEVRMSCFKCGGTGTLRIAGRAVSPVQSPTDAPRTIRLAVAALHTEGHHTLANDLEALHVSPVQSDAPGEKKFVAISKPARGETRLAPKLGKKDVVIENLSEKAEQFLAVDPDSRQIHDALAMLYQNIPQVGHTMGVPERDRVMAAYTIVAEAARRTNEVLYHLRRIAEADRG